MGLFSRGDQPLLHQYNEVDGKYERVCDGWLLLKGDAEAEVKAATTVRRSPHIKPLARSCKDCARVKAKNAPIPQASGRSRGRPAIARKRR